MNIVKESVKILRKQGIKTLLTSAAGYCIYQNKQIGMQFSRKLPGVFEIQGSKMWLENKGGLDRDLAASGIREPYATEALQEMLRKDDVVLEIGANIGYYALQESLRAKQVHAIEPIRENYNRLNENIAMNGYRNIETYRCAISNVHGKVKMYQSSHSNLSGMRKPVVGKVVREETVPAYELDRFCEMFGVKPTVVRMDVEGHEWEIVEKGIETLKKCRMAFIEFHPLFLGIERTDELLKKLQDVGMMMKCCFINIGNADLYSLDRKMVNAVIKKMVGIELGEQQKWNDNREVAKKWIKGRVSPHIFFEKVEDKVLTA